MKCDVTMNRLLVALSMFVICLTGYTSQALAQAQALGSLLNSDSQLYFEEKVERGMELEEALKLLEKKYNVVFLYKTDAVEGKEVSGSYYLPERLEEALVTLLAGENSELDYSYINPKTYGIYVADRSGTSEVDESVEAVQHSVTGRVTDLQTGEPLPGVNVILKSYDRGAATDLDGIYEVVAESPQDTLIFTYIGYQTQEIPLNGRTALDVEMSPQAISGEELVVVGYGVQERASVTGSVANVQARDLERVPATTASAALAGKLPGLSFKQADGRPGGSANIQIRNMGTPLFVIDGIQKDQGQFNNLAPGDIESITILKDASAAVYGSRAANGVIVVTTKQGNRGQAPTININSYYGWKNWTRFPRGVNAYEWMSGLAEAEMNQFGNTNVTPEELSRWREGTEQGYRSFDWYDFMIDPAPMSSVNVNVSGGSERTNYYLSVNRLDETAVFGDEFEFNRTNIQSNINTSITDALTVGAQINGRIESRENPGVPGIDDYWQPRFALFRNRPTERPYANDHPDYPADINNIETNWALLNYDRTGWLDDTWKVLQLNFNAEYELPIPGLGVAGMVSYYVADNVWDNHEYRYDVFTYYADEDEYVRTGGNDNPYRGREQVKITENVYQFHINYETMLNERHSISALAMSEFYERSWLRHWAHSVPPTDDLYLFQFPDMTSYEDQESEQARIGYVGRINYSFDEKYLLELSGRYDASWQFPPDNRWGFFPSVSVGWVLSREGFMDSLVDNSQLDELKLRVSYGQLGDDGVGLGSFDYLPGYNYGTSNVIIDGQMIRGARDRGIPIDNLSWYTSNIFNAGMDFMIGNGKLGGSIDYFYRKRDGLRGTRNDVFLPHELGYGLREENLNSDAHTGGEIALHYLGNAGELNYRIGGNFSFARSKHLSTYNPTFSSSWDQYRHSIEDRWAGIFWGYQVIGQFQSQEEINNYPVNIDGEGNTTILPGDLIYKDVNGDGKIDGYDERPIGYGAGWSPIINGGINVSMNYKNFDLHMDFSAGSMYSTNRHWEMRIPFQNGGNLLSDMYEDRWHREDPFDLNSPWVSGGNPALRYNTSQHSNYNRNSDWWLTNVSYLRLRTFEIGYTMPASMLEWLNMRTARVYLNTYNLFSLDNVRQFGVDPEINDDNGLQYPQNVQFNIGINISI